MVLAHITSQFIHNCSFTNPAGAVTDAYAYRAFGAAWQGGNGSTNAYRYAGEYGYYRDSAAVQYVRAYSCRRATIGSRRDALIAGYIPKKMPTVAENTNAPITIQGGT